MKEKEFGEQPGMAEEVLKGKNRRRKKFEENPQRGKKGRKKVFEEDAEDFSGPEDLVVATENAKEGSSTDKDAIAGIETADKVGIGKAEADLDEPKVDQNLLGKKDNVSYSQEEMDKIELSRKGSEITLARIKDYSNLLDKEKLAEVEAEDDKGNKFLGVKSSTYGKEGEEESNRIFLEKTRELWKELAVHGVVSNDKTTGKPILNQFPDLDGKGCLGLLKLAGIKVNEKKGGNVDYVKPGESRKGKINFDTGNRQGVIVEDEGMTAYVDHHDPVESEGKNTSATKETYKLLTSMGLLKKEKYLDRLVEFVTNEDNKLYYGTDIKKNFLNSALTILGLNQYIPFKKLADFFEAGGNPLKPLDGRDLDKYKLKDLKVGFGKKEKSLIDISEERAKKIKASMDELERMEKEGLIVKSDRYGKIAVDIDKKVSLGNDAATAFGCNVYMIWAPGSQSFFISSARPLEENFSQGEKVRDRMWIKPRGDNIPLTLTLEEILKKMTDGKFNPEGELKEFIEKEKNAKSSEVELAAKSNQPEIQSEPKKEKAERKTVEFSEKEKRYLDVYIQLVNSSLDYMEKGGYLVEQGYDPKDKDDFETIKKADLKKFWEQELYQKLLEDGKIKEETIPKAIKEIKKEIKKLSRLCAEAQNSEAE
jgi:hypothetical protein